MEGKGKKRRGKSPAPGSVLEEHDTKPDKAIIMSKDRTRHAATKSYVLNREESLRRCPKFYNSE